MTLSLWETVGCGWRYFVPDCESIPRGAFRAESGHRKRTDPAPALTDRVENSLRSAIEQRGAAPVGDLDRIIGRDQEGGPPQCFQRLVQQSTTWPGPLHDDLLTPS